MPIAFKFPGRDRATRKTTANAIMHKQILRCFRGAPRGQIGRRSRKRKALLTRADRHRNHVLLQPLIIANTRVAPSFDDVDKVLIRDNLQTDIGIGYKKRRHDMRQHKPGCTGWNIELQRSSCTIAMTCRLVKR
jgi:hypothetical protein